MASETRRRAARWAGALFVALGLAAIPAMAFAQQSASIDVALASFSVTPSPQSVAPGSVTFDAVGGFHQLTVIRTDLAPDALPQSGNTVDLSGLDVIGATSVLAAGETAQLSADLTAGNYVLICNVPSHYDSGMRAAFTVSAQVSPPAAGNATLASSATAGGSSTALVALLLAAAVAATFGGRALTSAAERRR